MTTSASRVMTLDHLAVFHQHVVLVALEDELGLERLLEVVGQSRSCSGS